jgi:hypothetical protein
MNVKQLTLKIPNRPAQLAEISEILGEAGVNIIALFVSTYTPDGSGQVRFVANNPPKAVNALNAHGIETSTQDVIAAETPHHPGGLLAVLNPLRQAGINVDYLYPCISTHEAILILGVEKQTEEAVRALKKSWVRLVGEELYNM